MPVLSAIALGISAVTGVAGAISGAEDRVTQTEQRIEVDDPSAFEQRLQGQQEQFFNQLQQLTQAGGGEEDVRAATEAQRSLADRLNALTETGGIPGAEDISAGQSFAEIAFAPQRELLSQAFEEQRITAGRQRARLGREGDDPILQARLAASQTRQTSVLGAQQQAQAQQLAFALPGQRLQFAAGRADVLSGLGSQAFRNQAALLSTGNQLRQQERQFRLATATRTGTTTREGSFGQALLGGLAGASAGFGIARSIGSLFQGGGEVGRTGFFGGGLADPALAGIGDIGSTDPFAQSSTGGGFQSAFAAKPSATFQGSSKGAVSTQSLGQTTSRKRVGATGSF